MSEHYLIAATLIGLVISLFYSINSSIKLRRIDSRYNEIRYLLNSITDIKSDLERLQQHAIDTNLNLQAEVNSSHVIIEELKFLTERAKGVNNTLEKCINVENHIKKLLQDRSFEQASYSPQKPSLSLRELILKISSRYE